MAGFFWARDLVLDLLRNLLFDPPDPDLDLFLLTAFFCLLLDVDLLLDPPDFDLDLLFVLLFVCDFDLLRLEDLLSDRDFLPLFASLAVRAVLVLVLLVERDRAVLVLLVERERDLDLDADFLFLVLVLRFGCSVLCGSPGGFFFLSASARFRLSALQRQAHFVYLCQRSAVSPTSIDRSGMDSLKVLRFHTQHQLLNVETEHSKFRESDLEGLDSELNKIVWSVPKDCFVFYFPFSESRRSGTSQLIPLRLTDPKALRNSFRRRLLHIPPHVTKRIAPLKMGDCRCR